MMQANMDDKTQIEEYQERKEIRAMKERGCGRDAIDEFVTEMDRSRDFGTMMEEVFGSRTISPKWFFPVHINQRFDIKAFNNRFVM